MKIYSVTKKFYFTSSDGHEYQMADGHVLPKLFRKYEDAMDFYRDAINDSIDYLEYNKVRELSQIRTVHGNVLYSTELAHRDDHGRCIIYVSLQNV